MDESDTTFWERWFGARRSPLLAAVLCFFLCPFGMFYFGWRPGIIAVLFFGQAHWVAADVLTTWIMPPWVKPLVFFTWAYAGWRHAVSWNAEWTDGRWAFFGSFASGVSTTALMLWIHVLLSFPVITAFVVADSYREAAGFGWLLLLLVWSGAGIAWLVLGSVLLIPWMRGVGYLPAFRRSRRSEPSELLVHATAESGSEAVDIYERTTVTKDGRLRGMKALVALLTKAGIRCTGEDYVILERDQQQAQLYETRLDELYDGMLRGFFACAAEGAVFVPLQRIVDTFKKTLEDNYPEASEAWLKFARTYWTLKLLVDDIVDDDFHWIGAHLLARLARDISCVFVPMPGPAIRPPAEREKTQREMLREFGPAINAEQFIKGNPILIRDRIRMKQRKPDSTAKGLVLMLAVSVVAFLIVRRFIGDLAGGISAGVFFVAWGLFNGRAGKTGLFKANLRVYFRRRSTGASHEEAMARVVQTRYPFSSEKQDAVMHAFSRTPCGETEEDQLKALVYTIYCQERGAAPPDEYKAHLLQILDNVYRSVGRKYAQLT